MSLLMSIIGLLVMLSTAYFMSNNKKAIKWKPIGVMIALQLATVLLMFKTTLGMKVVEMISNGVNKVMGFANAGIGFVTGGWVPAGSMVFFVNVLLVIVFTSTLLSILTYIRVLPLAIKFMGGILAKITGLPRVESFAAVSAIVFGQSEVLLAIQSYVNKMSTNRLMIVSASAMGSISASIMGAYMTMVDAKYVLVAMVLNMFSMLIIGSIITPIEEDVEDVEIDVNEMTQDKSIFEAIMNGALTGGKVALIIGAMLIAYLGLIEMFNVMTEAIVGKNLTTIIGYMFAPITVLMGVPVVDAVQAGSVMGTKLLANEFVSISMLQGMLPELHEKTVAIITTAQISFASIGSIGMVAGSVKAFNDAKANELSKYGLKLLAIAFMGSMLSGVIVGLFI